MLVAFVIWLFETTMTRSFAAREPGSGTRTSVSNPEVML
jgi:hypothetical protein